MNIQLYVNADSVVGNDVGDSGDNNNNNRLLASELLRKWFY